MTSQAAAHRSPAAGAFSATVGVGVAVLAALVLIGWVFGLPSLKSVLPGFAAMQVNAALCFLLAGVGLSLLAARPPARPLTGRILAALCVTLAILTLLEHLVPTGLKLDEQHLRALEALTGADLRGRMSFYTALIFLLFGTALLLLDAPPRWAWLTDLLVILPLLLCLLALTGAALNFFTLLEAGPRLSPVPIVLALAALGLALLAARPDRGGMAVLSSPHLGAALARRLLPAAVLVPFLLGWLRLLAEQSGTLGRLLGPVSVLADVVVFSGLVLWYAATLNRSDEARQRAVEEVRHNERHFRALIEGSHDAVTLHGADGTVLYASPAVGHVLGYAPGELVGRNALTLVHPDDAAAFNAGGEYRVRQKDGSYRWVEATATNLLADPDVGGVVTSLRDVEDRKRSEQAIAGYAERLRILRQIDRALISGVSPEEIAVGALPLLRDLLGVGRAIVNLIDLEKGEVEWLAAGRERVQARPGVRYSLQLLGDAEQLRNGQPQMIDTRALPPGPEVEALLTSGVTTYAVVPMIAGGQLIGALSFGGSDTPVTAEQIGIAQEVATQFAIALTQARLLEQVRQQAEHLESRVRERTQQLEAANRELEAFSYSVSHDLRAPLRAINGFSRILMEEHAGLPPDDARDLLREVRDSAREMGQLVDGLLAFSRLGRQPITAREVQPRELVDRCLDELREERAGRDIDISVGALPECRGDPVLLKQVWFNLLSNALKYSRGKSPARIEVGSQADSATPAVTTYFVKDNGVGFDMRYADKLFGVFQRLHRAEEYEGTGVGLAIVQRIVQRHGGRIWAEARPDEGATFFFTLEGEP